MTAKMLLKYACYVTLLVCSMTAIGAGANVMGFTLTEDWLRWILGGGVGAIVYFLKAMVGQMKGINDKISDLLIREATRDGEIRIIKGLVSSRPCLKNNGCEDE